MAAASILCESIDRQDATMIGKRFAQYEVTALLGKGGMGEVYTGPRTPSSAARSR